MQAAASTSDRGERGRPRSAPPHVGVPHSVAQGEHRRAPRAPAGRPSAGRPTRRRRARRRRSSATASGDGCAGGHREHRLQPHGRLRVVDVESIRHRRCAISASVVAATSSGTARVAIVRERCASRQLRHVDGAGEPTQPGEEGRVGCHVALRELRRCRSSRRRRRRTTPGRPPRLDVAERRAHRAPRRLAAELGPRLAGVLADAAPQRHAGAGRRRARPTGRPAGVATLSCDAASGVGRAAERVVAGVARRASSHRRERLDRQPQRATSASSGSAARRSSVTPAGSTTTSMSGRRRRSASHAARSSVTHTSSTGRAPPARSSASRRLSSSSSPSMTLRADEQRPGDRARRRPATAADAARRPLVSPAALARPGAGPPARARGRRRRGRSASVSLAPTLTSAARATSSSSRAWVRRRWSAVLADSCLQPVGARQLALDRGDRRGRGSRSASRGRLRSAACPGASAGGSGRAGATAASISSPRRATCQLSSEPVVEAVGDVLQPVAQRARRRRRATVSASCRARALGALHELPPRLADGERVDRPALGGLGIASSDRAGVDDQRRWRRRRGSARRGAPATTPAAAPSRIRHESIALAVVAVQKRSRNAIVAKANCQRRPAPPSGDPAQVARYGRRHGESGRRPPRPTRRRR